MEENKQPVDVVKEATTELERAKDVEAINRVMKGVNDTFEKHYEIKHLDMDFNIKVKFPNALDQGKIHARTSIYLDGMNRWMPPEIFLAYNTMAMLHVCGEDIPEYLLKEDEIYNMEVFIMIGEDIRNWMDTFQR